jgi:VanZ family protein
MVRALFSHNPRYSHRYLLILSIILSTLYGLSDEIHQSFVSGRNASGTDVIADGVGAVIGTFSYWKMDLART